MKLTGLLILISTGSAWTRHVRCAGVAMIFFAVTLQLFADDTTDAYTSWVKPWTQSPVTSPALNGAGLRLIVSCVQGETNVAAVKAMSPVDRLDLAYHIRVAAAELATNGGFRSYFVNNTDAKTSTTRWLTSDELAEVDQLLAALPDDQAQLPPPGNRIVMQVLTNGQWKVRVYDGNHLPGTVTNLFNHLAKPYGSLF